MCDAVELRLGVVSYLNAVPLVHGLDADPRFEILRDVPARIADALHAGRIDLGVIPSIEYAGGDYAIVPEVAITSRGRVRSVCLFHRRLTAAFQLVAHREHVDRLGLRLVLQAEHGVEDQAVARPVELLRT